MKIIIPEPVKQAILLYGNKTAQKSAYKIYGALYKNSIRKNSSGYFAMPSSYLESINKRYNLIISHFIDFGIIKYYERPTQGPDIFTTIYKKYYNRSLNICMKYKFLIDITQGETIEMDMDNPNNKRWYNITYKTLEALGYENIKISRDSHGRRVHHQAIYNYKEDLHNKGLSVIDAKCSQPRLLYLIMKERGIIDIEYNNIFDNGLDFYGMVVEKLELKDRQEAKDLFMFWINSSGYVTNFNIHKLFPRTSQFIKSLKNKSHKDSSAFLQREEAKIWIDDLLENIPTEFALSIHDSLIVRDKDLNIVLTYCKNKYPQIEFDIKEL